MPKGKHRRQKPPRRIRWRHSWVLGFPVGLALAFMCNPSFGMVHSLRQPPLAGAQITMPVVDTKGKRPGILLGEVAAQQIHQPLKLPPPVVPPRSRQKPRYAPQPIEAASMVPSSTDSPVVPHSAFEACVINAESGGNPTIVNSDSGAGGLYQFLPSTWATMPWYNQYPGGAQTAPPSVQQQAFNWLFARDGDSPWRPSDGCTAN